MLLTLVFGLTACSKATEKAVAPDPPAKTAQAPSGAALSTGGDLGYGDDARLFDSAAAALVEILKTKPRVLGLGEFHNLESSAAVRSALSRFNDELLDVIAPQTSHLVLETWSVDPTCGKQAAQVTRSIASVIERPKNTENEMLRLMRKAKAFGISGHVLQFDCDEYTTLLGKEGLDVEALLTMVSAKLGESAARAAKESTPGTLIVVYGGATHNNLSPYKGLESWSYAPALAQLIDGFVEIDLYVPELVADDPVLTQEAWYPLLAQARSDKVILIRREPGSYILLLRKGLAP